MEAETCFQNHHNAKLDLGYENTMRVWGSVIRPKFYIHSVSLMSQTTPKPGLNLDFCNYACKAL